jgi:hypothetical protein
MDRIPKGTIVVETEDVLVQVVELEAGREIGWGTNTAEYLRKRADDIRKAIQAGAGVVVAGLDGISPAKGWTADEVSVSFGVTLAAESGVILSKASTEATFEVSVTYRRRS